MDPIWIWKAYSIFEQILVWFGLVLDFPSFEQWFMCAPTYTRRGLKVHHVPGTFVLTKPGSNWGKDLRMPLDTTQSMFPTSPPLNTADGTENSLGALSPPPPSYSAFTKIQCCGAGAESRGVEIK